MFTLAKKKEKYDSQKVLGEYRMKQIKELVAQGATNQFRANKVGEAVVPPHKGKTLNTSKKLPNSPQRQEEGM